jgi:hypothetical protein
MTHRADTVVGRFNEAAPSPIESNDRRDDGQTNQARGHVHRAVAKNAQDIPPARESTLLGGVTEYLRQFASERPEVVVLGCFSLGFALGWKLKRW